MMVATWQRGITEHRDGEQVGEIARRRRYAKIVKDLRLPEVVMDPRLGRGGHAPRFVLRRLDERLHRRVIEIGDGLRHNAVVRRPGDRVRPQDFAAHVGWLTSVSQAFTTCPAPPAVGATAADIDMMGRM